MSFNVNHVYFKSDKEVKHIKYTLQYTFFYNNHVTTLNL